MASAPAWVQADLWDLFDVRDLALAGLDRYLKRSLERCADWFRVSGASLFLSGDEPGLYMLSAKAGRQQSLPENATVAYGWGIAGMAIKDGRPRVLGDPTQEPDLQAGGILRKEGIVSSMVVPLIETTGVCLGVLNLSRADDEDPFDESDLDLARALAAHLTLAISNARLVDRLRAALGDSNKQAAKLRGVLDSVPGAMLLVDRRGAIEERNKAAEALFGSGADLNHALRHVECKALAKATRQAAKAAKASTTRVYDPDTDRTWMVDAAPYGSTGVVVTVQEVTTHERSERDVARMRRLAEIGQMTAAIAHEIRNPVTGIRAAAQVIKGGNGEAAEFGAIVEEEALKLDRLCTEFLEFARPVELAFCEAPLREPLSRVGELLRPSFLEAGVNLHVEVKAVNGIRRFDRRRVEQVLHNLLRNALQASSPGDTVTLKQVSEGFEVIDQGVGMSVEQLAKLFTPFFTTKANGSGLGLCNVRKIIDAHGGSIEVKSSPGKGSKFVVKLPGGHG